MHQNQIFIVLLLLLLQLLFNHDFEIEKVDVFRKVLNKQFIERLKTISIINKTQLQAPTDCFNP